MAENNRDNIGRDRDLVLAPGEFAFVLDTTKGLVNTYVGPYKNSMSNTDQPVVWDRHKRRVVRVEAEQAIQINTIAPEGFYTVLYNPAEESATSQAHPRDGGSSGSVPLKVGHKVNIPGPANFPLWPGQMADVIKGHHLRSNQYLLAQVYNDTEATANWKKAVLKPQAATPPPMIPSTGGEVKTEPPAASPVTIDPVSFTPGQLMIIKGTDVAFFIPPTGIKVVPETPGVYVREAVTLERLEYCILLDEDGNKRFVRGPNVVFPEPTEQFVIKPDENGKPARKFRAIELNETTGIYVKVIADYEADADEIAPVPNRPDWDGSHYHAGDELFITGKEQAIYFQREEHSVIRYGEQTKHYAVAVPAGEGRYVLNRNTGVVALIHGPKMLLCDPRYEVIVRRVIAEKTVRLWYPNNEKVVEVNKALEALTKIDDASQYIAGRPATANFAAYETATLSGGGTSKQIAGDVFARGTKFQPPRTITLDTKYEGAVSISVWTGYAVLVISKTGNRRVVIGPETFLLEYDETLAPLELSTGRPKTDDRMLNTVYLRIHNNKVSDIVHVETKDLVHLSLAVSYRVNFEGDDPQRWFAVENYVQLLSDHMRSLIRNVAKRKEIQEFYGNTIDIVRDAVLGNTIVNGSRPGRAFTENNMRVYDLEVMDVSIDDKSVAALLLDAQSDALKSAITVSKSERALVVAERLEEIKQKTAEAVSETLVAGQSLLLQQAEATQRVNMDKLIAAAALETQRLTDKQESQALLNGVTEAEIARKKQIDDQILETRRAEIEIELKKLMGESEEIVKRTGAVSPNLAIALTTFADQALIERISESLAPISMMSGVSAADVLAQLFKGTPLADTLKALGSRSRLPVGTP